MILFLMKVVMSITSHQVNNTTTWMQGSETRSQNSISWKYIAICFKNHVSFIFRRKNIIKHLPSKLFGKQYDRMLLKCFWWQIGHNVVPVGEWLDKHGGPLGCPMCSLPIETLRHCLWDCPQAQKVWDRVTCLLAASEVEGTTSWSVVAWIDHSVDGWTDSVNADSWCYVCIP